MSKSKRSKVLTTPPDEDVEDATSSPGPNVEPVRNRFVPWATLLPSGGASITHVACCAEDLVLVATDEGVVYVFESNDDYRFAVARKIRAGRVLALSASHVSDDVMMTATSADVVLWNPRSGERVGPLLGATPPFIAAAMNATGSIAVAANSSGDVAVWDVPTRKLLGTWKVAAGVGADMATIASVAVRKTMINERDFVAVGLSTGGTRTISWPNVAEVVEYQPPSESDYVTECVAISPDGSLLMMGESGTRRVTIVDWIHGDGDAFFDFLVDDAQAGTIREVVYHPTKYWVSVRTTHGVSTIDLESRLLASAILSGKAGARPTSLDWLYRGNGLVIGYDDGSAVLWYDGWNE